MAKKFKRSYSFALLSAFYITLGFTLFLGLYQLITETFSLYFIAALALFCFVFSFSVIQFRAKHIIYRQVKSIYDHVSLLESSPIEATHVTTDMETLTKEIEKFAEERKLEIQALKVRENYRKEFMGNISHELKTPLFTVQGYILTLLDGAAENEKIRDKYLKRASKGVDRLIYIVQDLDMITKLETGSLHLHREEFDVREIIQNVFELLEMKAAKRDISLTLDGDYTRPIHVNADRERIQQVLTNLVVNSIKYGKEDGTTEISIESLTKEKTIVRVTDNGEGVSAEHIPRLFERFYRVDQSGSRKEGGSGLGLSIVKHILEAHGEKLYVESDFGLGSEFSFTLQNVQKPVED